MPPKGGWADPAYFALEVTDASSSPRSTESSILLLIDEDVDSACLVFCPDTDCSFEGGLGGCSGSEWAGPLSPKGPSGPRESSTASSRVVCAPTRRGVLGPFPAGERGDEMGESEFGLVGLGSEST